MAKTRYTAVAAVARKNVSGSPDPNFQPKMFFERIFPDMKNSSRQGKI